MSVTKAEVTKAAVSYTLTLGYEIKKEQLDVIVQYVLTEIRKVHANLFNRSFPNLHNNSSIVNRSSSSTLQSQNPTATTARGEWRRRHSISVDL